MFGYVTASWKELTAEEQKRYGAVYCGICREIRQRSTGIGRICLSYDMAFLALLLMSLYEPEEESGKKACRLHSVKPRPWVDNEYIRYAADMNVALGYYNCLDDWQEDGKRSAKFMADKLEPFLPELEARWPRQLGAIRNCISRLSQLEKENCPNPDEPASCFGELMAQLLVYREDMWAKDLGQMGFSLGRFIYLLDAAADYDKDKRKGKYNPYLAMGMEKDEKRWEEYLVLAMGRCAERYEKLPLVQDKALLDNILYSGVWVNYRGKRKEEAANDG